MGRGRREGVGEGVGTRQSRRKQQRSESAVHTHTRQLQRGPETNGKGTKPNRTPPKAGAERDSSPGGTVSLPPHTPRAGRGDTPGCWGREMGGLLKNQSPPRWDVGGAA